VCKYAYFFSSPSFYFIFLVPVVEPRAWVLVEQAPSCLSPHFTFCKNMLGKKNIAVSLLLFSSSKVIGHNFYKIKLA
jgi:hypothetical protein